MKKNIIVVSILCLIILFLGLISYSSKIVNPFIGLKGLILMNSSDKDIIQISIDPVRYIGERNNVEGFINYMTKKGYNADGLGSAVLAHNDVKSLAYDIEGFFLSKYNIYTEFDGQKYHK
ncbi:MAG: hypothetical protein RR657_07465 [Peptostreptococcaceae bacterium]